MHKFYFSNSINLRWYILFGLIIHFISAYFSIGYYNADEHYQVIGPLERLLNIENKLTWEFDYKIRPWLQSYIYFFLVKPLYFFNIENPFIVTFLIRLFSSILGFVSILYLYNHFKFKFNLDNNLSKLIIFTFWFYAYLHARTSSENLSISMMLFGIVFFDKFINEENQKNKFSSSVVSGIFLGLSMIFRWQIVISIFFIFIWFFFNKFSLKNFKYIILNSLFIIILLLLSLVVDYFGYGVFNITYYEYYKANFLGGWFSSFGKDPWWYYLKLFFENFFPPINIIIFASILFFWLKEFKNIITYITLPVIILLSFLSHKELRFIFPILIFAPFFLCYLFSNTRYFFGKLFIINASVIINLFFYLVLIIPATEQVKVYQYLYYNQFKVDRVFFYDTNPYIIDDLEPSLYTSSLPEILKYKTESQYKKSFIILRRHEIYEEFKNKNNCKFVFSVYSKYFNKIKIFREREFNWYIFKCEKIYNNSE